MIEKGRLRQACMAQRDRMTIQEIWECSASIQGKIMDDAVFQASSSIFIYVSVGSEVATRKLLQISLAMGKKVYIPRCYPHGRMQAVRIDRIEDLIPGRLGIPEPREVSETITARDLDLMLIPCIAAGFHGERLGHGGGYYDRFLQGQHGPAYCLCFEDLVRSDIPMDAHDQWMDAVVTEKQWRICVHDTP